MAYTKSTAAVRKTKTKPKAFYAAVVEHAITRGTARDMAQATAAPPPTTRVVEETPSRTDLIW